MAGDWIKVEKATARKPEVLRIAAALDIHPDHAFGLCIRFWSWCDDQLQDANARGVSETLVDSLIERKGFASALLEVGWLQVRNGSLVVPHFDRHLSQSAKTRALTARRVAKNSALNTNGRSVSSALAREEKRREETPIPPLIDTERFRTAWCEWQKHRSEIKKPLKPTQEAKQLNMLAGIGESRAVAMIEFTIEKGWQGLREPEGQHSAAVQPSRPVPARIEPASFT